MESRGIRIALYALMGVLILILLLSAAILLQEGRTAVAPEAPAAVVSPEAPVPATEIAAAPTLPPPVREELPTYTPTATLVPTETPTPTPTPEPTATSTPEPSPTATSVPIVVIQPTAVPPTPTAVPPTPVPPNTNGLTALSFGLQPRSVFQVGQPVWFEFNIANSTGGPVPFGALGVMPRKDGADRPEWYQHSWGGNDDVIPANGLQWEDNIKLPQAGAYTLRLVICFADHSACRSGGPWVTLSSEIPVTIN